MALCLGDIFTAEIESVKNDIQACFAHGPYGERVFVSLSGLKHINRQDFVPGKNLLLQLSKVSTSEMKLSKAKILINIENSFVAFRLRGDKALGKKLQSRFIVTAPKTADSDQAAAVIKQLEEHLNQCSYTFEGIFYGPVELSLRTRAIHSTEQELNRHVDNLLKQASNLLSKARSETQAKVLLACTQNDDKKSHEDSNYRRIELLSGANLIYEKTEACYTYDVNTALAHSVNKEELLQKVNAQAASALCKDIIDHELYGLFLVDFAGNLSEDELKDICHEISLKLSQNSTVYVNYELRLSVAIFSRGK